MQSEHRSREKSDTKSAGAGSAERAAKQTQPASAGKRTPAQERARYLRHLYVLLALIAILLFTIALLIPDRRASVGGTIEISVASERVSVGTPEPGMDPALSADSAPQTADRTSAAEESPRGDPADTRAEEQTPGDSPGRGHDTTSSAAGPSEDTEPATSDDPGPSEDPRPTTAPAPVPTGTLYFVLDDVGYSMRELEPFLSLDIPMTISILPHLRFSRAAAEASAQAQQDVILHLPMEPTVDVDPGPGAILVTHSSAQVRRLIDEALASVPGAIGANNHMGSAATADRRIMTDVISELSRRGLFFLDSLTSSATAVPGVSNELSVQTMRRDFFIDHVPEPESMREMLSRTIAHAASEGRAIAIGHVQTSTLPQLLKDAHEEARSAGVRFEGLSHYREHRFAADWNAYPESNP